MIGVLADPAAPRADRELALEAELERRDELDSGRRFAARMILNLTIAHDEDKLAPFVLVVPSWPRMLDWLAR